MVESGSLTNIQLISTLLDEIKEAQRHNEGILRIREKMKEGKGKCFQLDEHDVLWFGSRLVVPKILEPRKKILDEAYETMFSIHPGNTKRYHDLKQRFWWTRMKR